MPNDAKLGMVIGVGLVIAVAVLFFRRDLVGVGKANVPPAAPSVVTPPAPAPKSDRPRGPLALGPVLRSEVV